MNRTMARAGIFRASLQAAVGTHLVLSLASLAHGSGVFKRSSKSSSDDNEEEAFDAFHYQFVTDFVSDMYAGKGMTRPHVLLHEKVTFEDPAAICSTPEEVQEAFRALKYVNPESLSTPKCIDVTPKGESIDLTYRLDQRYAGMLEVQSLLVVNVQLAQIYGTPESEFVVRKFEERWNGVQPLGTYLFWIVRRMNGLISWNLTSRLLKEQEK